MSGNRRLGKMAGGLRPTNRKTYDRFDVPVGLGEPTQAPNSRDRPASEEPPQIMSGSRISSGCAAMTAPNMYKVVHEPTAKHFDEFDLPRVVWGIKGAHYHRYHNNSSPVLETAGGWHAGVAGSVVCSAED